jgi:hypothetical protein
VPGPRYTPKLYGRHARTLTTARFRLAEGRRRHTRPSRARTALKRY